MAISDARKRANEKYNAKAYDKFLVRVKRGEKAEMEEAAKSSPEGSLNGYVVGAIKQRMKRDKTAREGISYDQA